MELLTALDFLIEDTNKEGRAWPCLLFYQIFIINTGKITCMAKIYFMPFV